MTTNAAYHSPIRPSLNYHLVQNSVTDDLRHLVTDIARACKYISYAIETTEFGLAGTINQFGEKQEKLDVISDTYMRQFLCENGSVHSFISEEQDDIIEINSDGRFGVVFDPLDGSSLVEANFSIGTIVGIYDLAEGKKDILGKTPRQQCAALYVLYGPRTVLVYSAGDGVHQFILNDVGEFILLEANLGIADDSKHYSPGNLRAITENQQYKAVHQQWLDDAKTLRYSGCMVADIHHILAKGQGIFTNIGGGEKYPNGKLRHAIECGPFAYIVEHAGGASSDGTQSILDKQIETIDQRTPIIIGSTHEVAKTVKAMQE